MAISLKLLGGLRVRQDRDWLEPTATKPLCLLLYLALSDAWVSRDQLSFLFWPDSTEAVAKTNLRQLLRRSKRLPFANTLEVEANRLRWQVETDVSAFRGYATEKSWSNMIRLYKGPLLDGFHISRTGGFEAWLERERQDLASRWRYALASYADALELSERFEEAATVLKTLLDADSLAEDVLQRYLKSAYMTGQREAALKTFGRFAAQLQAELDLGPLETTLELVRTIEAAGPLEPRRKAVPKRQVPLSVLRPPRLIGREHDLAQLRSVQHPLTLIAGEAGVGKSRLMTEAAPKAQVLRCQEGLTGVPYYPVIALLRELSQTGLTPDLGLYLEDLARLVPELAPTLRPGPADPDTGRARLLEALARYLESVSSPDAHFQLIVDDLQWADEATLALLLYISKRRSLKLLAAYRSHELTDGLKASIGSLRSAQLVSEWSLTPLNKEAVRQLMASLMHKEEGPRLFSDWLCNNTGGNPLFVLETLKSLFETGALHVDDGTWHTEVDDVTADYSELTVPKVVAEVIQRRTERLSEGGERVLQAAAVVGEGFSEALLSRVSGLSEAATVEALEEAEEAGLVRRSLFTHDLVRQSIYGSLPGRRRRRLHAQVALHHDLEPARRAEHWLLADQAARAAESLRTAGIELMQQGLLTDALELLKRALVHTHELELGESLQLDIATIHFQRAHYQAAGSLAETLLRAQDPRVGVLAHNLKARLLLKQGQIVQAEALVRKGLDLAQKLDAATQRHLLLTWHLSLFELGRPQEAGALLEAALPSLRRQGKTLTLAKFLTNLAAVYNHQGNYEQALALHLEAFDIVRQLGARHLQVEVAQNLVYCYIELGRSEAGLALGEEALELGEFDMTDTLRANLAAAYIKLERYHDAISHYEALTESAESGVRLIAWGRLAGLYAWTEQEAEAVSAVAKALTLLDATQAETARSRAVVAALRYGTAGQIETILPLLEEVKAYALPPYLRAELDEALSHRKLSD